MASSPQSGAEPEQEPVAGTDPSPLDPQGDEDRRRITMWPLALAGALLAGLASWTLGESRLVRQTAGIATYNLMGQTMQGQTAETIRAASRQTAARYFAVSGGLLSLAAGLAGWLSGRARGLTGTAALLLPIAWALLCGLAAWFTMPLYDKAVDAAYPEMAVSIVTHLALWVPVGIGAAVALATGMGAPRLAWTSAPAGAVGALLGVIVFEFLGALLFPLAETGRPLPGSPGVRLLAWMVILLPAVLLAASSLRGIPRPAAEVVPVSRRG